MINSQDMDLNIINSFLFHPRTYYNEMGEKDFLITVEEDVQVGARFHMISQSSPTILLSKLPFLK